MLEGLDSVDWQHLTHAYGPATDVPDVIRALVSADKETREQALYELYGTIWHQGTVYQATAYAVPFLIELLKDKMVQDKDGILDLLSCIARGRSGLDAHKWFSFFDGVRDTPEFKAELAEELAWVHRSHKAVGEGIPLYLDLLHHPDSDIRMKVLYLLSLFKEEAQRVVPMLRQLLANETDDLVTACAVLSLAELIEYESPEFSFLRSLFSAEQNSLLRFIAALAITRCAEERTPLEVLRTLIDAVDEAKVIDPLYSRLPWRGLVVSHVDKALVETGPVLGIPSLIDMLYRLEAEEYAWSIVSIVIYLLDLAFYGHKIIDRRWASSRGEDGRYKMECWWYPGKQRCPDEQQEIQEHAATASNAGTFTEAQRSALSAVVNYDPLWEIDTNLFEVYGLPNSREALRRLLVE
jgi:hypothetical protein